MNASSVRYEISQYKNTHNLSTHDIGKILQVTDTTVRNFLKSTKDTIPKNIRLNINKIRSNISEISVDSDKFSISADEIKHKLIEFRDRNEISNPKLADTIGISYCTLRSILHRKDFLISDKLLEKINKMLISNPLDINNLEFKSLEDLNNFIITEIDRLEKIVINSKFNSRELKIDAINIFGEILDSLK